MNMRPEAAGKRRGWGGALLVWLVVAAAPASAQVGPLTTQNLFFDQAANARLGNYLAAEAGLIYTDNVNLAQHGMGDTLASLGLIGDAQREGPRLDYHLDSDLALVKYLRGNYRTDPSGYLDGQIELKIVPGLFGWIGRETYSQTQIDAFTPATPDNLEDLNYATTGPRFTWRPTLRTSVKLDALYSRIDSSSRSPLYVSVANHRYTGDLDIDRAVTGELSTYLKGSYDKVIYSDQVTNTNFRLAQGSGGLRFENFRTSLDASVGYAKVITTAQFYHTVIWAVNASRLITPTQRLAFTATRHLTDAANLFRLSLAQPVPGLIATQRALGQPFVDRAFGADWRFQAQRTALEVAVLDDNQHYIANPLYDRDLKLASALLSRQLSPVLNWDVGVRFQHENGVASPGLPASRVLPPVGTPTSNLTSAVTNVRWRVAEKIVVRFLFAHTWQSPVGYKDNQVGVTVSYALIGSAQQAAPELLTPALQPIAPASTLSPVQPVPGGAPRNP